MLKNPKYSKTHNKSLLIAAVAPDNLTALGKILDSDTKETRDV